MMRNGLLAIAVVLSCRSQELPVAVQKTADLHVPELHDPYQLPNILGAEGAYVETENAGTKSEVPKVDINLRDGKTNYYEIQRCPEGAKLETASGIDPLTHSYAQGMQALKEKDYLYVWGMATAGACTLLAGKHMSAPFIDKFNTEKIGGTDGFNFFYLVRPCLFAGSSIYRGKITCSYAFARTNTIEGYINNVAQANLALTAELASQRTRLEHRMMQMAAVIRQKAHYLKQCEFQAGQKNAMQRRLAGIAKVALTATAAVVGTVASGGTAGFLAGTAAAQLGDKLFSGISNATLDCPTGAYDKKNEEILADVEKTIAKIREIRSSLGELDLDGKDPPPAEEAISDLVGEECGQVGLGENCTGADT